MWCGTDCGELIKALEDCHAKGYMNKVLGNCNGIKHELNMCLREEVRGPLGGRASGAMSAVSRPAIADLPHLSQRLLRTARNREEGRSRRAKTESIWKAIDDDS